jgi:phosphate:Na+ symporter
MRSKSPESWFLPLAALFLGSLPGAPLSRLAAQESEDSGLRPVALSSKVESVQPFAGIVLWDTNEQRESDAIQLEFSYVGYGELVDAVGAYDWSHVEKKLDAIAARGHQAILRFYLVYPGKPSQVPAHLRALPDYKETVAKSEGKETPFPDWSHPALKSFVLDFHTAFAERYDEDPRLAFVQVGFGLWAEYHIYDGPFELGRTFPDRAYQGEFLRHLASAYRRTPFSISVDAAKASAGPFDEDPSLLDLPFGVFDDSLLNKDHGRWNRRDWEKVGLDRSLRAPAGGEFSYYNDHDQKEALAPDGPHGESYEAAARRFGLSYVIGDDQPRFRPIERIREAGLASGYRFRIVSFESGAGRSRVRVRNEGVAPIYHDAFVDVEGTRAETSLRGLAPGKEAVFEIPAGGEAPRLSIECDRLVPGQSIGFDAELEGAAPPGAAVPSEARAEAPPPGAPAGETASGPARGEVAADRAGGGVSAFFPLAGGIGLFLLGMALLTEGVKAYAGQTLRRALVRFTGTPAKAFASGALTTSLVQSSSATTVSVIGFVSAGLLGFPQAIGVILGASFGTTATGWLVAGLGLKVSVGLYAMPLVCVGAFLHLLADGKARAFGTALAGFGLIFTGIDHLQEGMRGLSGLLSVADLPGGGFAAHLAALGVGVAMTVAMQSSSAAVATTLTALHAGAIQFEQAASLVVGAAIGTTVTGVIAAIGGTVPAKRTALAHVLFNLATGLIALALLPVLLQIIGLAQRHLGLDGGALSLAAFHTIFIGLGVALFLPLAGRFAALIEAILPDRGPMLTRHLDRSVLRAPAVALEASKRALASVATGALELLSLSLGKSSPAPSRLATPAQLREALDRTREFLGQIPAPTGDVQLSGARLAQLHAIDHLDRLLSKLEPPPFPPEAGSGSHDLLDEGAHLAAAILERAREGLSGETGAEWVAAVEALSQELAELRRGSRPRVIEEANRAGIDPVGTLALLDRLRWYDRIAYHTWRTAVHLGEDSIVAVAPPEVEASDEAPEPDAGAAAEDEAGAPGSRSLEDRSGTSPS